MLLRLGIYLPASSTSISTALPAQLLRSLTNCPVVKGTGGDAQRLERQTSGKRPRRQQQQQQPEQQQPEQQQRRRWFGE